MRTINVLLCLLGSLFANAQTISVDDAMSRALDFLNKGVANVKSIYPQQSRLELAYTDEVDGNKTFYVFNQSSDGGFVIVGGDEAAVEILGYCDKGKFDYSRIPPGMKAWLDSYSKAIGHSISMVKSGEAAIEPSASLTRSLREDVSTICATTWDQASPYNLSLANGQNPYCTGCVATAAAQVMKVYDWPSSGMSAVFPRKTLGTVDGTTYVAPEIDLGMTYRWDRMIPDYSGTFSEEQGQAVSELMYAVGRSCGMIYGTPGNGGSASSVTMLASALGRYFKYDKSLEYNLRYFYSDEEWEQMVYDNLSQGRPVIYGADAYGEPGGHCFVVDGYDSETDRYHVNWGWSGYCDGYFAITGTRSLQPSGSGSGGSDEGVAYSVGHDAIMNVFPDMGGEDAIRLFSDRYYLNQSCVEACQCVGLFPWYSGSCVICNLSNNPVNVDIAVRFRNTETEETEYFTLVSSDVQIDVYSGYCRLLVYVPSCLAGGTYELSLVYKDNSGNWVDTKVSPGQRPCILTVNERDDRIKATTPMRLPNNDVILKDYHEMKISYRNVSAEAQNGVHARLYVCSSETGMELFHYEKVVNFAAGEEKCLTFTPDDISDEQKDGEYYEEGKGYYIIPICHLPDQSQCQYDQAYVTCAPLKSIDYLLDEEWSTLCLPFDADIPVGMTAYTLGKSSSGQIVADVADRIVMNTPYVVTGEKKTYRFTGPATYSLERCGGGILRGNTRAGGTNVPYYAFVLQNVGGEYQFVRVDGYDRMCPQYHAYVAIDDAASHEYLSIPLSATAVETVAENRERPADEPEAFYNIAGQCVGGASTGIVVSRGKKVLRK